MEPKDFAHILIDTVESGNNIWFFGNGGSHTIASHFSEDLAGKKRSTGLLWPIYTLGSQQALFTANCNDNCYEEAIAIELRTYSKVGVLFLAISTSGRSLNVVKALKESLRRGLKTYLLTSANFNDIINESINLIKIGKGSDADIELEHAHFMTNVINYVGNTFFTSNCKRRAIFLDRDGTLIPETVNGIQIKPDKLLPGIPNMLRKLKMKRYLLIIISNQSVVGRGEITIEEHWSIHKRFEQALNNESININDYYYCYHDKAINCECRKPETGSFFKASKDWGIELKESLLYRAILEELK
jgi:histidinol-phosphate phosphatase family protein